jgi:hemerythrin-like domain-containing protein
MTHWKHQHGSSEHTVVQAALRHHAALSHALADRVEELLVAVESGTEDVPESRRRLVEFCDTQLLPHARAEESSIYPAAATDGRTRLLIEAMIAEHRIIADLVEVVRYAYHPVRAAAAGEALRVLFDTHVAKEDGIVYPLVAAVPGLSLNNIMAGMNDLLEGDTEQKPRERGSLGAAARD